MKANDNTQPHHPPMSALGQSIFDMFEAINRATMQQQNVFRLMEERDRKGGAA